VRLVGMKSEAGMASLHQPITGGSEGGCVAANRHSAGFRLFLNGDAACHCLVEVCGHAIRL
jgi:hypothetical protein